MSITMIWAMDERRLIGNKQGLPWYLPNDMKFFRNNTIGKTVIMGRKTYRLLNGALPKRRNLVMTRNMEWQSDDVEIVRDVQIILSLADKEEVIVIGGTQIYTLFMPYAHKLLVTRIKGTFIGSEYFPAYDERLWKLEWEKVGIVDEKNEYPHIFQCYVRRKPPSSDDRYDTIDKNEDMHFRIK